MIKDHHLHKKCSRLETSTMNFLNLISRDKWTFHYQETLCVIYIYSTPIKVAKPRKTMPGNHALSWLQSLCRTNQMSRPPSKTRTAEMDFAVKFAPLARTPPPRNGVYIDRCINRGSPYCNLVATLHPLSTS